MNEYSWFADYYDKFNDINFQEYYSLILEAFSRSSISIKEVLDLGCGTGEISLLLAQSAYNVTAVDISSDMLDKVKNKITDENILLVCQDMCSLDLCGTVQAVVCTFDCFNYLKNEQQLDAAFKGIRKHLEPGGIFFFDVNTKYTFEKIYADNAYVYEYKEDMMVWQNQYTRSRKSCKFYLTLFQKQDNEYIRKDEVHIQKYFPPEAIDRLLRENGFDILECRSDMPGYEDVKQFFVCKAI